MTEENVRNRPARWWLLFGLLTAGLALPFLIEAGQFPWLCTFKRMSGVGCPGCGLTRSVFALMHGQVAESVKFHLFGPLALAAGIGLWAYYGVSLIRGRQPFDLWGHRFTLTTVLIFVGMIVYWVVRLCLNAVP